MTKRGLVDQEFYVFIVYLKPLLENNSQVTSIFFWRNVIK